MLSLVLSAWGDAEGIAAEISGSLACTRGRCGRFSGALDAVLVGASGACGTSQGPAAGQVRIQGEK